jgi:hypothetical protein
MAILPLGHEPTQLQSPGDFVAGLWGPPKSGYIIEKCDPHYTTLISGEAGCVDARAEAQKNRCQLGTGTHVSWFYGVIQCARLTPGGSEVHW